ncbi:hypothetical protein DH86_00001576 [Scytalidium sp. 3C]|nr:hypothetical protein DH86_00001576 [Scytalidium sp. 3C]
MQFSVLLPISLLASYAAAQTTSACAAQPVLEACLASTQAIASDCASNDYNCLCPKWKTVLQCFEQCPNDSRYGGILSTEETYCADMSVYTSAAPSTSATAQASSPASAAASAPASTTSSADAAVRTADSSSSSSSTSSGAAATQSAKSSGAKDLAVGAGSMIMAVAGFMGAFF